MNEMDIVPRMYDAYNVRQMDAAPADLHAAATAPYGISERVAC